jgi:nitroreductase
MLHRGNREKSRLAPVVAIFAHDVEFWQHLDRLHPHVDAAAWFRHDAALARETALRNGTLQAAYFMGALRAVGVDIGPLSGFDAAAVQEAYFAGTSFEVNFICNIGYGDSADPKPRLPRLSLEEIVHRPAMRP